jgi:hypothetical protein
VAAGQQEPASAEWGAKMSTFLGRARVEVQRNKDSLAEAVAQITGAMRAYAVDTTASSDSGKTPQEEFLALFGEFCQDWKKAREDNVRALRMLEKTRQRVEQTKRDQMAKDEKRKRLVQVGKANQHMAAQAADEIMAQLQRTGSIALKTK